MISNLPYGLRNGKRYGQLGNERYLYIGNERIQIFSKVSKDNSTEEVNKQQRSVYGQIKSIQDK